MMGQFEQEIILVQEAQKRHPFKMTSKETENAIPEFSSEPSEDEKKMSLKEKLALIDNEVRELYDFCVKAGYSPDQIEKCAEPILVVNKTERKKKWFKRLAFILLIVALIATVFFYEPAYDKASIYCKLTALKVSSSTKPPMCKYIYSSIESRELSLVFFEDSTLLGLEVSL